MMMKGSAPLPSNNNMWNRRKLPLDCFLVLCIVMVVGMIVQTREQQTRQLANAAATTPCAEHLKDFHQAPKDFMIQRPDASSSGDETTARSSSDELKTPLSSSGERTSRSSQTDSRTSPTKTTVSATTVSSAKIVLDDKTSNSQPAIINTSKEEEKAEHNRQSSTTATTTKEAPAAAAPTLPDNNNSKKENDDAATISTTTIDNVVIDMISIGSKTRLHYQTVQKETFGTHRAVRHFTTVTEADDTDQACFDLSIQQAEHIYDICKKPSTYAKFQLMKRHYAPRKWLFGGKKQKNPVGWLCAQKRPLDALYQQLQQKYSSSSVDVEQGNNNNNKLVVVDVAKLPDYLFVMDDDSWFQLDLVLPELLQQHEPASQADLVAGCLIRSPKDERYAFYWGGFGLILTRKVLERLVTPLQCPKDGVDDTSASSTTTSEQHMTDDFPNDQAFVQYACQRLQLNLIGEQHFFTQGMSLLELIYRYGADQPYSRADEWFSDATYCMHSDTTLAYFLQYYHVGRHAADPKYADVDYDRIHAYRGSIKIKVQNATETSVPVYESRQECLHLSDQDCTANDHLCHYVTDTHMQELFVQVLEQAPAGRYYPRADLASIQQARRAPKPAAAATSTTGTKTSTAAVKKSQPYNKAGETAKDGSAASSSIQKLQGVTFDEKFVSRRGKHVVHIS